MINNNTGFLYDINVGLKERFSPLSCANGDTHLVSFGHDLGGSIGRFSFLVKEDCQGDSGGLKKDILGAYKESKLSSIKNVGLTIQVEGGGPTFQGYVIGLDVSTFDKMLGLYLYTVSALIKE